MPPFFCWSSCFVLVFKFFFGGWFFLFLVVCFFWLEGAFVAWIGSMFFRFGFVWCKLEFV